MAYNYATATKDYNTILAIADLCNFLRQCMWDAPEAYWNYVTLTYFCQCHQVKLYDFTTLAIIDETLKLSLPNSCQKCILACFKSLYLKSDWPIFSRSLGQQRYIYIYKIYVGSACFDMPEAYSKS